MLSRPLRILMISTEVESLARTGGLGDVVESLSRTFAAMGAEVLVVTPLYGVTKLPAKTTRWDAPVGVRVGWGPSDVRRCEVVELDEAPRAPRETGALRICLLDEPALFGRRDGIYGDAYGTFGDNELRFATLSRGALEIAARAWPDAGGPDVIHAHDWHAALAILYARLTMGDAWAARPSVFTIHNLAFQGLLHFEALDHLAVPRSAFTNGALAHYGHVNLMKGAIAYADCVTTVSPSYAAELLTPEHGFGLDAFMRTQRSKLRGILNGIDMQRFDPKTDPTIARNFDARDFAEGRLACKRALAAECGLDQDDGPIFATVSRLTVQKGMDLLLDLTPFLVERGARVIFVGQGDADLEARLRAIGGRFPGRVCGRVAFDPTLARRVYAGADFFAVPSRYEPCGLTQLYAMRYGAIPIVTAVGGLRDTVEPISLVRDSGTGIVAPDTTPHDVLLALEDALHLYPLAHSRAQVIARAMARDSSWGPSAEAYFSLYRELVNVARSRAAIRTPADFGRLR